MEIKLIDIGSIIPYNDNPRKNKKAIKIVKESIEEFGFKNPILIDKNNVIIAGHTRLEAAKELGMTGVPTIYVKDLTEDQIKAFRIMDNKSSESAEWDYDMLKREFKLLENNGYEISKTGFKPFEREEILSGKKPNLKEVEFTVDLDTKNECPKCGYKY